MKNTLLRKKRGQFTKEATLEAQVPRALVQSPPAITSVPARWHGRALSAWSCTANVPIVMLISPAVDGIRGMGVRMKLMHICYAALGFAVARWVFKRQPVADPVSRLRCSGLL